MKSPRKPRKKSQSSGSENELTDGSSESSSKKSQKNQDKQVEMSSSDSDSSSSESSAPKPAPAKQSPKILKKSPKSYSTDPLEKFLELHPDLVKVKSSFDDEFSENDEFSTLQVPKNIDPASLQNLSINLDSKTKFKIEKKKYLITPSSDSDEPLLLLLGDRLKSIQPISQLKLQRYIKEKHKDNVSGSGTPKVLPPDNLKMRHPLFGSEYETKIELDLETEKKLHDATVLSTSKSSKRRKKDRKMKAQELDEPEPEEVIFELLRSQTFNNTPSESPNKKTHNKSMKDAVEDREELLQSSRKKKNSLSEEVLESESTDSQTKKKKKKKKNKSAGSLEKLDLISEILKSQSNYDSQSNEEEPSTSKKSKKIKIKREKESPIKEIRHDTDNRDDLISEILQTQSILENPSKKKERKRKLSKSSQSTEEDDKAALVAQLLSQNIEKIESPTKKKKKDRVIVNSTTIAESNKLPYFELDLSNIKHEPNEKNKKKQRYNNPVVIEEELEIEIPPESSATSLKKKKKKSKKEKDDEESGIGSVEDFYSDERLGKKVKKEKKIKKDVENPLILNLLDSLKQELINPPTKKKKKKVATD